MDSTHDILVIGTGFAGIGMGVRLRQMGLTDFVILEQADGVGGTWRDNTYPGAACDVQSHLYSFSFEQNPRWSRMFAEQHEILDYLNHVADKYGVRPHIRFGCQVVGAEWSDARGQWKVTLQDGRVLSARALIAGSGGLSRPAWPELPGRDAFRGTAFHTARWDHEFDFEGKVVGVIGTGASAIQVVPAIAPRVKELKLFQRTPPWVMPKPDRSIRGWEQRLFAALPFTQRLFRESLYWQLESRVLGFVVQPKWMEQARRIALRHLRAEVRDPELRAKLTPNYAFGCKRVLMSNDYLQALQRDNVEVVTDPIAEVRAHSIATRDGRERALDAIIYATGFQVGDWNSAPFEIRGTGGLDLTEAWRGGAEAYLGVSVAGFPNFFLITGPNTGLGHSSMVYMIESQIQYIASCLDTMRRQRLGAVDVRKDVQDRFNRNLHARMARTIWSVGGCSSWYTTSAGKNTALWPGFTYDFRKRTRQFELAKYVARSLPHEASTEHAASLAGDSVTL